MIKVLKRLDGVPINIDFVVPKELIQNNDVKIINLGNKFRYRWFVLV